MRCNNGWNRSYPVLFSHASSAPLAFICSKPLLPVRAFTAVVVIHGLERLKRSKEPSLSPEYFDERLALFEEQRARLNGYFCNRVENDEAHDALRFEKMYAKYREQALDEVQAYRDVEVIEELRRAHGDPPKVRFLTLEEQREWERQYPKPFHESGGQT
jgi:hypothetical protein